MYVQTENRITFSYAIRLLFVQSIAWRKKIGIDNYLSWADFGAPFKDFEFHITGINHNGGPGT